MENEIEDFLPITPVSKRFKDENELVQYANDFPMKIIAHNLFCISEQLIILTNLLASDMQNKLPEEKKQIKTGMPFIYDKLKGNDDE